jgi:hypothetical protein
MATVRVGGLLGHVGAPAAAVFVATGLFLLATGCVVGAYWLFTHPSDGLRRTVAIGLAVVGVASLGAATAFPLLLGASPSLGRPATTARLQVVSPRSGEVVRGDPAQVHVMLRLEGGTIVPTTSLRLVPNEGHIHLYLDGSLVSMTTGLDAVVSASPGQHELRAEFVAVDHGPFQPRVQTVVTFSVQP